MPPISKQSTVRKIWGLLTPAERYSAVMLLATSGIVAKQEVVMRSFDERLLDIGIHESLLHASQLIDTIKHWQKLKIACPGKITYREVLYVDADQLDVLASPLGKSAYGTYPLTFAKWRIF